MGQTDHGTQHDGAGVRELDPAGWALARPAVHLVAQLLGQAALSARPFRNHWWQVGLQLTPTGLRTGLLRDPTAGARGRRFELELDFRHARLSIATAEETTDIPLDGSLTVAEVYGRLAAELEPLGVRSLATTTCEIEPPVRLDQSEVPADVTAPEVRVWLGQLHAVAADFDQLLTDFYGKTSGPLLYWGSLDLAIGLFNGKPNQTPAGAGRIYRFAENAENITFSYWADEQGRAQLCAYRTPASHADASSDYRYGAWATERGEVVCALTPGGRLYAAPEVGSLEDFLRHTTHTLARNGGWDLDALLGATPSHKESTTRSSTMSDDLSEFIDPSAVPSGTGCKECSAEGGWWFHLRRCTKCGHIGCCDSSPSQHARRHWEETGHRVLTSFEPGEEWYFDWQTGDGFDSGPRLADPQHHPLDQPAPGPAGRVPANWQDLLHG
ncbi:DUF5996 family protein [Galactobacter valiniphilus]|uniref:DUF5996 family protein n=1 Tax=Galactobacter valiniphilus TaxID=2676122 RepID=UPI0037358D2C